jgi:ABC-2 type transport system permease protein
MSPILASEFRRLLSRRLGLVIVILAVLAIVIAGIVVFVRSRDEGRMAVVTRDPALSRVLEDCEQGQFGIPPDVVEEEGGITEACLSAMGVSSPRFELAELDSVLIGTTVPLIFIAWLMGATFVGADWQKGTMTTVLTWESRRIRLLLAKVIACVVVVFAGYLLLQVILSLALLPAAVLRGSTSGVDGDWFSSTAAILMRGGLVATIASVLGMSIAMIGRNTGAALGAGFAYIAIIEAMVRELKPNWIPYLFGDNSAVFITAQPQEIPQVGHTTAEAAAVLIAYAVILSALAAGSFRVRDVT